jgi:hypothetical protein
MYDSTDLSQIPSNAQAVAGYVGGAWPNYNEDVKKWPKAHHLSIAVNSGEDADILDIENGDATVADAPAWFVRQIKRGVKLPGFYTSLSNVDALVAELERHNIQRHQYRLWSAHYTGRPHLCGPSEGISTVADGTQYYDKALSKNLDVSLLDDDFFTTTPPKPNTWQPSDEHNWCIEWDRIVARKTLAAHLRRLFLRAQMLRRRKLITNLAKKSGWKIENRLYRYEQLQKRSK